MTYPRYQATLAVAMRLHRNQVDKNGQPYVLHLVDTAQKVKALFEDWHPDDLDAALLHDAMEDAGATARTLRLDGIRAPVIATVSLLTHPKGQPYLEYIAGLVELAGMDGGQDAIRVKLADNLSNSSAARTYPGQAAARARKYDPAWKMLVATLDPELRSWCIAVRICAVQPLDQAA